MWAGPAGFSSTDQKPIRTNLLKTYSGVYTCTITDTKGCTNSSSVSVLVYSKLYINDNSTVGDIWCTAIGNDATGNGTPGKPYLTIAGLLAANTLTGGDTVFIDAGTYNLGGNAQFFRTAVSGTATNQITFIGADTSKTIYTANSNTSIFYVQENSSYLTFKNIQFYQPSTANGQNMFTVEGGNCQNIQIINCEFNNSSKDAGCLYSRGLNTLISNCTFNNRSLYTIRLGTNHLIPSATITGCTINVKNNQNATNYGILCNDATITPNAISYNKILGDATSSYGIYFDGVSNTTIENNFISGFGTGIWSGNCINNNLYFNSVYAKNYAIWGNAANSLSGWNIENNIFDVVNAGGYIIRYTNGTTFPAIQNYNLYFSFGGATFFNYGGALYLTPAALAAVKGFEVNGVSGDPFFIDPTNNDLHINTGSNAVDKGIAIPGITDDIDKDLRGVPPDIGADESVLLPLVADAGINQTICSGTIINIGGSPTAKGGATPYSNYSWSSNPSGFSSGNTANPTAAPVVNTTYTVVVTDKFGATAKDTVVILVNSPVTANAGNDQNICGKNVTLAGNSPSSGIGLWTIVSGGTGAFSNASSNVSSFTADVFGTNKLRWTITNPPCTASFSDVNITFKQSPSNANAGNDQAVCGKNVTLVGNSPSSGTGVWTIVSGGIGIFSDSSSNASTFTSDSFGTYQFQWTITNPPCAATSSVVNITFKQSPSIADAGSAQTICGTSSTLVGNTPTIGTGLWTIVSDGTGIFSDSSISTSTFTADSSGTYKLRWTITNPPCAATSSDVNITFKHIPSIAIAGTDQSVCGENIILNANIPVIGTGLWTIISGGTGTFADSANSASSFTADSFGTYKLKWTISNPPCAASDSSINITFVQNPTVADAGVDQKGIAMCGLTNTTLAGNTPLIGVGTWSVVSGIGGVFENLNSPATSFSGLSANDYTLRWTITNDPCTASTSDVNISFYLNPNVDLGADKEICFGQSEILNAAAGQGKYLWNTFDSSSSIIVKPTISTDYSLTITENNLCTASNKITILVNSLPVANFIANPLINFIANPIHFLSDSSKNVDTWHWDFGDGNYSSDPNSTDHIYKDTGIYTIQLVVKSSKLCEDTVIRKDYIKIIKQQKIYVPSGFTPNGDGNNDILYVYGEIASMHFEIYNQWGLLVFVSDNISVGWDGKYKNIDQPEGNYFYLFQGLNYANEKVISNGIITLIR